MVHNGERGATDGGRPGRVTRLPCVAGERRSDGGPPPRRSRMILTITRRGKKPRAAGVEPSWEIPIHFRLKDNYGEVSALVPP